MAGKGKTIGSGSRAASCDPENTKQWAGHVAHQEYMVMMRAAAKERRARKGRGNGTRYCYNGIKPKAESVAA